MTVAGSDITKCLVGQIADYTPRNIISFAAEQAIEFGRPLMRGTNKETQCMNFIADVGRTVKFLGISARNPIQIDGTYPVKSMVSIIDYGRVWIHLVAGLTIVAGNNAYLNQVTNTITNVSTSDQIPIGRFQTGGTSNGLTGTALFELELIPGFQI
jgi:hypothetical protein